MGFDTWVDPHPGSKSVDGQPTRGKTDDLLGIPRSLVEPTSGMGKCTKCGERKLLDIDGMVMWHPSKETHKSRYNDEGDKRRGCLGAGLPPAR